MEGMEWERREGLGEGQRAKRGGKGAERGRRKKLGKIAPWSLGE